MTETMDPAAAHRDSAPAGKREQNRNMPWSFLPMAKGRVRCRYAGQGFSRIAPAEAVRHGRAEMYGPS